MNTKYNELEDRYEVDPQSIVRSELLNVETPNKYVTYAGLERAVKNVLSKAKDYDKGLVGGYNGSFPLTAATKGNIYLLPATKKYYVCITDYSGSQLTAPNANFEELSVYTNRSKLDNLIKSYNIANINIDLNNIVDFGVYYMPYNPSSNIPQNFPKTVKFFGGACLIVFAAPNYTTQMLFTVESNCNSNKYYRIKDVNAWSQWSEF